MCVYMNELWDLYISCDVSCDDRERLGGCWLLRARSSAPLLLHTLAASITKRKVVRSIAVPLLSRLPLFSRPSIMGPPAAHYRCLVPSAMHWLHGLGIDQH